MVSICNNSNTEAQHPLQSTIDLTNAKTNSLASPSLHGITETSTTLHSESKSEDILAIKTNNVNIESSSHPPPQTLSIQATTPTPDPTLANLSTITPINLSPTNKDTNNISETSVSQPSLPSHSPKPIRDRFLVSDRKARACKKLKKAAQRRLSETDFLQLSEFLSKRYHTEIEKIYDIVKLIRNYPTLIRLFKATLSPRFRPQVDSLISVDSSSNQNFVDTLRYELSTFFNFLFDFNILNY